MAGLRQSGLIGADADIENFRFGLDHVVERAKIEPGLRRRLRQMRALVPVFRSAPDHAGRFHREGKAGAGILGGDSKSG